jgi:hypothetical protein
MLLVGLSALVVACGDSTSPSAGSAAGSYTAITFITQSASGQRDEIAAGSTLVLNLNANGTTSGHLHVAASSSNAVLDEDMAGTWTQTGLTVDISQSADTFVRDMTFTLSPDPNGGWDLIGNPVTFGGRSFTLTLKRA